MKVFLANLLKSERVPQSKSQSSLYAEASDTGWAVPACPPHPPAQHCHGDPCVWAFCPNSKLNLHFFSCVCSVHSAPECEGLEGISSWCSLENLCLLHWRFKTKVSFHLSAHRLQHLSPRTPGRSECSQWKKKIALQSLLFSPSPHATPVGSSIGSCYSEPNCRHASRSMWNQAGQLK